MFLIRFILFYLLFKFLCCGRIDLSLYRHFCPFTNFCSNSSFPVVGHQYFQGDQVPCCLPCYCDEKCWSFSDCCPDIEKVDGVDLNKKATCQQAHFLSKAFLKSKSLSTISEKYVIQSECPYNYTGLLVDKCAELFDKTPELEDIAVVSDSIKLNRVYKNKYCAECNGVTDFKRWKARTGICKGLHLFNEDNLKRSDVWQYLLDNCEIQFLPLPEVPRRSIYCSLMSRMDCKSGKLHLGLDVHQACLKSSAPMYVAFAIPQMIRHRNLFCYLCVTSDREPMQDVCDISDFDVEGRNPRMILLLDLRPEDFQETGSKTDERDSTGLCKLGELFDRLNVNHPLSSLAFRVTKRYKQ